ncbi:MAGE family-domain-containing protein [Tricharina praecox]|uniref:MAGE family-domain-containing protein n=1 Tax=Tricharina praecox TaxID=43433 RepID=UPI00221EF826|nr:MAGE family-domain-containing protein [Tricharina praecox]KAI5844776.1 MAGE family-domain-containing protein [Tricharina praecox]
MAHEGAGLPHRLAKNLVRFALVQELQRVAIKRSDITSKVTKGARFKSVFTLAQKDLRDVFGMELAELPRRDKTRLAARRAAQTAEKTSQSLKSYILTSTLPAPYKDPAIIAPHGFKEQTYDGFVTFVVAVIYLNGRTLSAQQLGRYLARFNADEWMPLDRTEKILQLMMKQGYIIRVKDDGGDSEHFEYHLGPRAKVEIGQEGVLSLIKTVYGDEQIEDLEAKFKRNVGVDMKSTTDMHFDTPRADADDAHKKKKKKPMPTSDEDEEESE